MKLNNQRGAVLVFSLLLIVVLISLSAGVVLRTVFEAAETRREVSLTKAFYLSEVGTQMGVDGIDNLINNFMLNTVSTTSPPTIISKAQQYASDGKAIRFLCWAIQDGGTPLFTCPDDADPDPEQLTYVQAASAFATGTNTAGTYEYTIVFEEKNTPVAVTPDTWDFNYLYTMTAGGDFENNDESVVLTGDFTVRVQRDNFAKYALFTNDQETPGGSNVWFTDKTNFDGPLHTNNRFNIFGNPSGTFDGLVTQVSTQARYYNNGFSVLLDDDHNGTTDVPTFNAGFNRDESSITLSSAVAQQDVVDQATGLGSFGSSGIYVPNNGTSLTGGIYVNGDADSLVMNVDASNNAQYTITQGGTVKTITVNKSTSQTTVFDGSSSVTYSGVPDGIDNAGTIIYVEGAINQLSGTVQENTAVTVASANDIVINNHVQYQNYTAGSGTPGVAGYVPPTAVGADNLLGIVSWAGNVRIGTSAPDDISVHGTVLAQQGIFTVDDYNSSGIGPRGTATVLGGVITDSYGAFGTFSGSTGSQLSGYGRNFVYDGRMQMGSAPPYFPTLNTFIAFTNDITDRIIWQEGS